jgi:hypothetical protein
MINGEIDNIRKVEAWSIKPGGEVVQILLAINVNPNPDIVGPLHIGQYIMAVPRASWKRIGQCWKSSGRGRLIAVCADIRYAGLIEQSRREHMKVIDLAIPGRIWTDVRKIEPRICNSALGGIAR